MWDFESLRAELSEIGFTEIRRAQFGDGDDPLFLEGKESPAGLTVWVSNAGNDWLGSKLPICPGARKVI